VLTLMELLLRDIVSPHANSKHEDIPEEDAR
jgi:hypothetical protein